MSIIKKEFTELTAQRVDSTAGDSALYLSALISEAKRKEIEDFVTEKNLSFPILYDYQRVVTTIIEKDFLKKNMGMPTSIFLDRSGNARFYHEAYKPGDEIKYEEVIKVLLRE